MSWGKAASLKGGGIGEGGGGEGEGDEDGAADSHCPRCQRRRGKGWMWERTGWAGMAEVLR